MLLLIIGRLPPRPSLFLFFLLSVYYSACGLRAFAFFIKKMNGMNVIKTFSLICYVFFKIVGLCHAYSIRCLIRINLAFYPDKSVCASKY